MDLRPHLTNTSLQRERGEEGVRLLKELIGCQILNYTSPGGRSDALGEDDVQAIVSQMVEIIGETFQAATQMPVHFLVSLNELNS